MIVTCKLILGLFEKKIAVIYAIFMSVNPMNMIFGFTFWGELIAAQMFLITLLLITKNAFGNTRKNLFLIAVASVIFIATVHIRSNFIATYPLVVLVYCRYFSLMLSK